jgi:two-component system, LytTR family, sensor histidine kinase AlgZ
MPSFPSIDPFAADNRPMRRNIGPVFLRTIVINQLIALPIGLVLTTTGGSFLGLLTVATVYSQTIGLLCAITGFLTMRWLDSLPPLRAQFAVMAQFFACGVGGGELARRICGALYGPDFNPGPPLLSWAIGATIALLVGLVLMTMRQLRARVVATELQALQARINPHFLFNTLNSIAALIREDPERAEAMTLRLSALFRYTLQAPRGGLVTLGEELTIVEGYLAIEQERLGSRLTTDLNVDAGLHGHRIPALTLQPLVENAIKHGVATGVAGGTVSVRGWREGDVVHLTVVNTRGDEPRSDGAGEGLDNVRQRLRATFGARSAVTLRAGADSTEAHVTFPVRPS